MRLLLPLLALCCLAACVPASRLRDAQAARDASQQALEALTQHLATTKREYNKLRDQYNALETFSTQQLADQQTQTQQLRDQLQTAQKNHADEINRLQTQTQKANADAAAELALWRSQQEKQRVANIRYSNVFRDLRDSLFTQRDTADVHIEQRENAVVIGYSDFFLYRPASLALERPAKNHLQTLAIYWQTNNDLQIHIHAFIQPQNRAPNSALHLANQQILTIAELLLELNIAPQNIHLHTQILATPTPQLAPIEIHLTLGKI